MASTSLVGWFWRSVIINGISQEAWDYITVSFPVVVIGAPVGSVLGSHCHRLVLAGLVMFLDTASLIGAFAVTRPLTTELIVLSVVIIVASCGFFALTYYAGNRLLQHDQKQGLIKETNDENVPTIADSNDEPNKKAFKSTSV